MQTNDTIDSWSGGREGVRTGTVNYHTASSDIVNTPANSKKILPCQDPGMIDAGASSFRRPGKKGIPIAVLQDAGVGLTLRFPGKNPCSGQITGRIGVNSHV